MVKRYRIPYTKRTYLQASQRDQGYGRQTKSSNLRCTFQLLKSGKCTSEFSDPTPPVKQPSAEHKTSTLSRETRKPPEPSYVKINRKQIMRLASQPMPKPVPKTAKNSAAQNRRSGTKESSVEDPTIEETGSASKTKQPTFRPQRSFERLDEKPVNHRRSLPLRLNVSSTIQRQLKIPESSPDELSCRISGSNRVQLKILGSPRQEMNKMLSPAKTMPRIDISCSPKLDSRRYDSYGVIPVSPTCSRRSIDLISPQCARTVSIPSSIEQRTQDWYTSNLIGLSVIGSRPNSASLTNGARYHAISSWSPIGLCHSRAKSISEELINTSRSNICLAERPGTALSRDTPSARRIASARQRSNHNEVHQNEKPSFELTQKMVVPTTEPTMTVRFNPVEMPPSSLQLNSPTIEPEWDDSQELENAYAPSRASTPTVECNISDDTCVPKDETTSSSTIITEEC